MWDVPTCVTHVVHRAQVNAKCQWTYRRPLDSLRSRTPADYANICATSAFSRCSRFAMRARGSFMMEQQDSTAGGTEAVDASMTHRPRSRNMPVSRRLFIAIITAGHLMSCIAVGESNSCAGKPQRHFVVRNTVDVLRLAHEAAGGEDGHGANLHALWVGVISVQHPIKVCAAPW